MKGEKYRLMNLLESKQHSNGFTYENSNDGNCYNGNNDVRVRMMLSRQPSSAVAMVMVIALAKWESRERILPRQ